MAVATVDCRIGATHAGTAMASRRVFVLGDSRTGTTSIHRYLQSVGRNSIHYYFDRSGVTDPPHSDHARNFERLRAFLDTSGYVAISDYPTRSSYRELIDTYADDDFVLTTRKSLETWKRSMIRYFGAKG